jgi:hypothetical protein
MSRDPDREIARLFRETRGADESSAPDFRAILTRPRARRSPLALPLRAAVALLVAAITLIGVLLLRRPSSPAGSERPASLSEWRASTDVLLRTPGADLLASVPALPEPLPDYSSIAGTPDRRDPQPTRPTKGAGT